MKLTKYIIASVLALSMSFTSCNDWLNIDPEDVQTTNQYWQTGDDVENILASGYYNLRKAWQIQYFWSEARANGISVYSTLNDAGKFLKLREFDILPTDDYVKWEKMYDVISMANAVIKYGPEVVERDGSFTMAHANSLNAEAYFLRSLAYFTLVRNFRDVPLVLEPYVTDEADFLLPKSTEAEVMAQIISDLEGSLEYAKEYFPEIDADSKANTKGRATRWALQSLLADIYLWRGEAGDYGRCVELCDAVIESGRVGLISGDRWFENFYPGNSNESVFELQYSYDLAQTNNFISFFTTGYVLSNYTPMLFNEEDLRGTGCTFGELTNGFITNWKFVGKDKSNTRLSIENDQNWIIYRLADIYLMKSEALLMQGDFENGLKPLNDVRERAGINTISGIDNELDAMNYILTERQREFVSEGKAWYDILRMARRDNYKYKEEFVINSVMQVTSASQVGIVRAKLSDPDAYYLPIHSNELKANKLLVQNPYYESLGN